MISRAVRDRIVAVLYGCLVAVTAIVVIWSMRQGWAVYKLRRGVGDTWFYAADGRAWFRMDEQRRDVSLDQISRDLQNAVVAVEDHRFYSHFGIDPIGLGRAIYRDARGSGRLEGGSTLTQQLARTLFLSNKRTLARKAQEAVLALLLEQELSKKQILELYLNRIFLSAGVYGVETMSRDLFGKPANSLSLPEAALIAGLIRAPSALSPWSNLDGALDRSRVVLQRMREEGFITPAQERAALQARPKIRPFPGATEAQAGYAKEFLRQQFRDQFGGDHPPDWQVRTTFVPELQDAAEHAVESGLRRFGKPDLQGALVAVDPRDGAIAALTGGFDYFASNYNRAVQAKRQPGSAFKPFLYSAALDQGFTPASVINDAPLVIEDPTLEGSWRPQNVTREFRGPMRLREALVRSRNLVSIRIMNSLGPAYATQYIERFGFSKDSLPRNLSLALGTASVSPLDMAEAYSVFANGGFKVEPYYLDRIISPDGKVIYEAQPRFACPECLQSANVNGPQSEGGGATETASDAPIRAPSNDEMRWGGLTYLQEQWLAPSVISPQNDFLMTDMMSDVIRRGTATRALQLKRTDLAGKTGTTNDRRDTWFCGFNAGLVATAWVGFDQERSLGPGEEGGRTALPMWVYFMAEALKGVPEQRRPAPPGLVSMRISADTGLAARPGDPNAIFETFMAGHLPAEPQLDSALGEGQQDSEEKKEDDSLF